MERSTFTSSSSSGHNNSSNLNNLNPHCNIITSNTIPLLHHHRRDWDKERPYDIETYDDDDKFKKSRAPSLPLSPDRSPRCRFTRKICLFMSALAVGILVPIWIVTTGVMTLDRFNEIIRYLPGYIHLANNFLYLVMFLLLVSFAVLATLPIPSIFMLCLPFHFMIVFIFDRLMSDWVRWYIGCFAVLTLTPVGYTVIVRIRSTILRPDHRREIPVHRGSSSHLASLSPSPSISRSPSPSPVHIKHSFLQNGVASGGSSNNFSESLLDRFRRHTVVTVCAVLQKVEHTLYIFSVLNRTSTLWRLLLALALWLSYVIPVSISNESRYFDPSRSAPSFDVLHPEPLCSARHMEGFQARHDSFEGHWKEYLELHRRMILPEEKGGIPQDQKQFLIFRPSDDGLGNRLQALLSTVVLAMVTKRAIILDWTATPQCNANFIDLFQQPDNLAWDFQTTFPDSENQQAYYYRYQLWYPYCRSCLLRSPITPDSTWSSLLCDSNLGIYETSSIVQVTSTHWFLPVIQHNPHWRQELCHMFPEGGKNAFEILAKTLLKPSMAVQQKIDSVMERVPDDVTLIGLQVRRTENNAVDSGIEESFLSCAAEVADEEEDKFLEAWRTGALRSRAGDTGRESRRKRRRFGNSNNSRSSSDSSTMDDEESTGLQEGRSWTRESSRESPRISRPKFAYYLATDYRPTRAHFQSILGDRLFVLDNTFEAPNSLSLSSPSSLSLASLFDASEGIITSSNVANLPDTSDDTSSDPISATIHSSSSLSSAQREVITRNSVDGVQTAVAEMFLLAQSDRIISSPYSTFGYFAHAYANVQPNIVKRDGTCVKRKSTQPCFQYWFGFANGGTRCNIRSTVEMREDYDCWL